MINKYTVATPEKLTDTKLLDFIKSHKKEVGRLKKLKNYYDGKQAVLTRAPQLDWQPDNRIVSNFCKVVTSTKVGYFIGKPVSLNIMDTALQEVITEIDNDNDTQAINMQHAENASVHGVSYEIYYADNYDNAPAIKYAIVDPSQMFLIYDNKINPSILYAVRYFIDEDDNELVEVYSDIAVKYYSVSSGALKLTSDTPHYFGAVPVTPFFNNFGQTGDFEPIVSLQDDYNNKLSDHSNDLELFGKPQLLISGATVDQNDIVAILKSKVMVLDSETDDKGIPTSTQATASWLAKPIQVEPIRDHLERIEKQIHKTSGIPDISDEKFSGNSSGVAIGYKLQHLEQVTSKTEAEFKKALMRRYNIVCSFLSKLGHNFNYRDIKLEFLRNTPPNLQEIADIIVKLRGIISDMTLLSLLPFIDDIADEIKRKEIQQDGELSTSEMQTILDSYKTKKVA